MPFPAALEDPASDALWWSLPTKQLAATLVILYDTPKGLCAVLTVRSLNMRHYPGDTALPGGRAERAEDWWETALREAREELGFDPHRFEFERVSALPAHLSAHYLVVRPVICYVRPKMDQLPAASDARRNAPKYVTLQEIAPSPSGDEVACAYAIPLSWFLSKTSLVNRKVLESEWLDTPWYFYRFRVTNAVDWVNGQMTTHVVGLTAHIMVDVAQFVLGKTPNFVHLGLGNPRAIESAKQMGLLEPLDHKV